MSAGGSAGPPREGVRGSPGGSAGLAGGEGRSGRGELRGNHAGARGLMWVYVPGTRVQSACTPDADTAS